MFFFKFVVVPEPFAFYPLNARYKAAEKENRQREGLLGDVAVTNGPYNEPGGAYMFYSTHNSYILFPRERHPSDWFSITLMCWVQPGGQDGPLFSYEDLNWGISIRIAHGKFLFAFRNILIFFPCSITREVLPMGKWVHVAASYHHNTGNNSLYVNGHLRTLQSISSDYRDPVNAYEFRMGSTRYGSDHFKGKIAEMKVYDVALYEAQIQTLIRQGSCFFPLTALFLPIR